MDGCGAGLAALDLKERTKWADEHKMDRLNEQELIAATGRLMDKQQQPTPYDFRPGVRQSWTHLVPSAWGVGCLTRAAGVAHGRYS